MTKQKDTSQKEKPKISVVDRRHWAHEEENSNGEDATEINNDKKLPTYVEQLKKDAEDYIDLYMLTEGGQLQLAELCRKFGVSDAKILEAGMVWSV